MTLTLPRHVQRALVVHTSCCQNDKIVKGCKTQQVRWSAFQAHMPYFYTFEPQFGVPDIRNMANMRLCPSLGAANACQASLCLNVIFSVLNFSIKNSAASMCLHGRGTFCTFCISSRSSGLHVSMVLYGLIRAAQVVAHEVEAMHSHAWYNTGLKL
jgi:hypothetical protein